jgi:enoyl-CoA hydratase
MEFKNLLFKKEEGVALITINRPKVMNALNSQGIKEIRTAIESVRDDNEVSAGIITGAGEKAFVAGADITEFESLTPLGIYEYVKTNLALYDLMESIGKPLIAAVNGLALGGGTELALACTFRIASEKAKFGLPEISLGVLPGAGGIQRMVRLVGKSNALWALLTGEMIDAQEAFRIGLVNRVVPPDKLMDTCFKLAKTIQKKGPVAVKLALESVKLGSNIDLSTANAMDAGLVGLLFSTEDKQEGIKAFMEKRAPQFKGK